MTQRGIRRVKVNFCVSCILVFGAQSSIVLINNLFNSVSELDPRLWMKFPTHILDLFSGLQVHIHIYVSFGFASKKDRLLTYSEYICVCWT